jgi:CBS domain-containing protein
VENDVGCLVVVRDNKPLGVITETDVLRRVVVERKDASRIEVRDIMSSPPVTIQSLAHLGEAVRLMNKNNVKRLVVVAENTGTLAGIVTATDLVIAESKLIGTLQNYIQYMGQECGVKDSGGSSD